MPSETLIDGEIVAIDENGRISFNTLQQYRSRASAVHFYASDLLTRSGRSMLELPLLKRRDALADMMERISKPSPEIQLSQAVAPPAAGMIRAVGYLGLEGIVVKRRESV